MTHFKNDTIQNAIEAISSRANTFGVAMKAKATKRPTTIPNIAFFIFFSPSFLKEPPMRRAQTAQNVLLIINSSELNIYLAQAFCHATKTTLNDFPILASGHGNPSLVFPHERRINAHPLCKR